VVFALSPYDAATFIIYESGGTYSLYLNGTPKTYDYIVSKSGYQSGYGTFSLTSIHTPTAASDFTVQKTFSIDPTLTRVIADVYTSDGVHYDGDQAVVRIGGAQNGTYLEVGGIRTAQNYATAFPATFVVVDSRASWNASMNITQGLYFATANFTLYNTTTSYRQDFYLPNMSTQQQCTSTSGCTASFCRGSVWYGNGRCLSGTCTYDASSCVLCDVDAGCYTGTAATTCPSGLDVECYGLNACIDTGSLRSYSCSSANACVYNIVACSYMCDTVDNVCLAAPPVSLCDQSTPVGMLTCMRSGIMNFINFSYNPLMTIGVVLFLVVLITAALGAGFKALTKTL
jgi:hypothetical protein